MSEAPSDASREELVRRVTDQPHLNGVYDQVDSLFDYLVCHMNQQYLRDSREKLLRCLTFCCEAYVRRHNHQAYSFRAIPGPPHHKLLAASMITNLYRHSPLSTPRFAPFKDHLQMVLDTAIQDVIDTRAKLLEMDKQPSINTIFAPHRERQYIDVGAVVGSISTLSPVEAKLLTQDKINALPPFINVNPKLIVFNGAVVFIWIARGKTLPEMKAHLQSATADIARWEDINAAASLMSDFECYINFVITVTTFPEPYAGLNCPHLEFAGNNFIKMWRAWVMRNAAVLFAKCKKEEFEVKSTAVDAKFPLWMSSDSTNHAARMNQIFSRKRGRDDNGGSSNPKGRGNRRNNSKGNSSQPNRKPQGKHSTPHKGAKGDKSPESSVDQHADSNP